MDGMTPYEKLKTTKTLIHHNIFFDEIFTISYDSVTGFLKRGGRYVYTKCESV